ncbi:MAG TPA: sigma-70 family RNA polymerase sigma factor [Candidatus Omnitrophota bacterium]|nr:sigma-70 family RNA polymerase sigma factor [Candidatus Omnitrophota bacterium]
MVISLMEEEVKIDFADVYNGCREQVWRLASRYVFTREDREDLFQEIFVNIHRALPRFRGESSLSTWIYRIAVNASINHLKKQKRHAMLKKMLAGLRIVEDEIQIVETELGDFKPLNKLNPRQRMILLLSDVEDKKLEEISSIMGLPVGTVKSNLHRARDIVKKEVNGNGKG